MPKLSLQNYIDVSLGIKRLSDVYPQPDYYKPMILKPHFVESSYVYDTAFMVAAVKAYYEDQD